MSVFYAQDFSDREETIALQVFRHPQFLSVGVLWSHLPVENVPLERLGLMFGRNLPWYSMPVSDPHDCSGIVGISVIANAR